MNPFIPGGIFTIGGIIGGAVLMIGVFVVDAYGNYLARRTARKDQHKNS